MTYTVALENQIAFENNFATLIEKSKKDRGCIWYAMTKSSETENVYKLIERWESQADLDNHTNSPDIGPFRAIIGPLVISSHKEVLNSM